MTDAFDLWWEWARKPLKSHATIPAEIPTPVMELFEEDRHDRAKVNEAVTRYRNEEMKKAAVLALDHGRMRILALAILLIGEVPIAAPAHAQAYDPNFPVCLYKYSLGGRSIDCTFTTLAQCNASASGQAAQCMANPFFAQAYPARRRYRR
jgi:hypothetical protein